MFFHFRQLRRLLPAVLLVLTCTAAAETQKKCRLPQRITVNIPKEVRLPLDDLEKLCTVRQRTLVAEPDRQKAFLRFEMTGDGTPEHPQGYVVEIAPDAVTVRARTPAGLFYGSRTVNDLLRRGEEFYSHRIVAGKPNIAERAVCFSINRRSSAPGDLKRLKRMLKILANLRYNRAIVEFGANFPAPGLFPNKERPLSESDLDGVVAFAAAHFIEIVPMLQVWGDCPMLAYRNDVNDLMEPRETGDPALTCCPRHPEVRKLLAETVKNQCVRLRPKEFFFRIDWNDLKDGIRNCPRCRDAAPEHLVAEHLAFLARCAEGNGVRPAFILLNFPDDLAAKIPAMLPAGTPLYGLTVGGRAPNTAAAGSDALPKELDRSVKNGAKRFIVLARPYTRYGDLAGPLYNTTPAFLGALVEGAFEMWSPSVLVCTDPVEYFRLLHNGAIPETNRCKATPVPIWRQLTAELGSTGAFPRFEDPRAVEGLRRALRETPERFELPVCFGGRYYGALLAGTPGDKTFPEEVEIPLGGVKTAAIALLLSCLPPRNPEEFDPARNGKCAFEYPGVALVVVRYADGTEFRKTLKYHRHFSPWSELFGGYDRRTAFAGSDGKRFLRIDSVVVKNRHPDKPATSLTVRSLGAHGIAPVLFAVSLLDVREGSVPASDPCDELLRLNFRSNSAE